MHFHFSITSIAFQTKAEMINAKEIETDTLIWENSPFWSTWKHIGGPYREDFQIFFSWLQSRFSHQRHIRRSAVQIVSIWPKSGTARRRRSEWRRALSGRNGFQNRFGYPRKATGRIFSPSTARTLARQNAMSEANFTIPASWVHVSGVWSWHISKTSQSETRRCTQHPTQIGLT